MLAEQTKAVISLSKQFNKDSEMSLIKSWLTFLSNKGKIF